MEKDVEEEENMIQMVDYYLMEKGMDKEKN